MASRWADATPATSREPHALNDASTWLLVLFLVLLAAPLVLGLS